MIHHISGRLVEKSPTHAVIEAHGVGYFLIFL
jgi:Holliday junction resolvasome RuvABC DNA-binding subunit